MCVCARARVSVCVCARACMRACAYSNALMVTAVCVEDLEVRFDTETQTMMGEDLVLTAYVKNLDKQDKDVDTVMAVRTCPYWNRSCDDKHLVKEKFPTRRIKAGCGG